MLYLYTTNDKKVLETKTILGIEVEKKLPSNELIEIQSSQLETVIKHKAKKAFFICGNKPVLVEHTGLFINDLNGFPGTMTQPFISQIKPSKICNLIGVNRKARVKTCIGFYNGHNVFYWTGETTGEIALWPKGEKGFGWDCIFVPHGIQNKAKKTFAQMEMVEKNKFSMRRKALIKLEKFIKTEGKTSIDDVLNMTAENSEELFFKLLKLKRKLFWEPIYISNLQNKGQINLFSKQDKKQHINFFGINSEKINNLSIVETPQIFGKKDSEKKLKNSFILKIETPVSFKKAVLLNELLFQYEKLQYFTYGDSILKVLRNYIIKEIGVENEDSLYIYRASNAKYFDEMLNMRTAFGEALYYNPVEMKSAIEYNFNAYKKNKIDTEMNAIFRNYVLPEVASIWIYKDSDIYQFAEKKGGFLFVPLISLAEVAAYLIRKNVNDKAVNFHKFMGGTLRKFNENDVLDNWAYKSFDMFSEKSHNADIHLKIIQELLKKHNKESYINYLLSPQNIYEIIEVLNIYKNLLVLESRDLQKFQQFLYELLNYDINLTEIILLKPGLKSRRFQIPNTPHPYCVFLQGSIDYRFKLPINQLLYTHSMVRLFLNEKINLFSIFDSTNKPILDMDHYDKQGEKERENKIFIESILLRFFTLLSFKNLNIDSKLNLINGWNNIV